MASEQSERNWSQAVDDGNDAAAEAARAEAEANNRRRQRMRTRLASYTDPNSLTYQPVRLPRDLDCDERRGFEPGSCEQ